MFEKDLLLIIDMQNVYLPGNPWACPNANTAAAHICELLDSKKLSHIAFTTFVPPRSPEGVWRDYNIENASINENESMSQIMALLAPYSRQYPCYEKSVYSSFGNRQMKALAADAERIILTGVVAECCVLSTAMSAIDAGKKVIYLTDAVAGFSTKTETETANILSYLSPLHTQLMTTAEYLHSKL